VSDFCEFCGFRSLKIYFLLRISAIGSSIIGSKPGIIDTSLHILFETTNYIPESSVFDLSILVLLLLINLTQHTQVNRQLIMDASAPSDFKSVYTKVPAIKELVEYFYKCEELAVQAEQNTDDLLDNPKKNTEKKLNVQEEVEETVTKSEFKLFKCEILRNR
jgi:Wings apart-like protein regulation of heterochromatin